MIPNDSNNSPIDLDQNAKEFNDFQVLRCRIIMLKTMEYAENNFDDFFEKFDKENPTESDIKSLAKQNIKNMLGYAISGMKQSLMFDK